MDYPKLRYINAFPVEQEGQNLICIQDPAGFCEKVFFVSYPLFTLMAFFDGQHSIRDIQVEYMRRYGELLYKENILALINELDNHLLLESERFEAHRKKLENEFRQLTYRPAALAGKSYEADPVRLENQLLSFFTSPEGPGPIPETKPSRTLKGVIAPHVDLRNGGPCFAWAYQEIQACSEADLFIIFGTAHNPTRGFFTLTTKDFETPLGIVETDKEFIQELEKKYPYDLYQDELNHKTEHSVEFQVVFLRYLYRNRRPIKILPILCGSLHELIVTGVNPMTVPEVKDFIQALREVITARSSKVCMIAGADLSHIGPRYGDPEAPSQAFRKYIAREDLSMLQQVEQLNLEGFFQSIHKDHNKRRVCGVAPIYALLASLDASQGKLLKYDQTIIDPVTQSVVSFASMSFY
jgi:AmmeMemoRadiSam system protein B